MDPEKSGIRPEDGKTDEPAAKRQKTADGKPKPLSVNEANKAASALKNFMDKLQAKNTTTDVVENVEENAGAGERLSAEQADKVASTLKNFAFKLQAENNAVVEGNASKKVAAEAENAVKTENAGIKRESTSVDGKNVDAKLFAGKSLSADEATKATWRFNNLMFKFQAKNAAIAVEENTAVVKNVSKEADVGEKCSAVEKNVVVKNVAQNADSAGKSSADEKNVVAEGNAKEKVAPGKTFSVGEASKAATALRNLMFNLQAKDSTVTVEKNAVENVAVAEESANEKVASEKTFSVDEASKAASALKNLMSNLQAKDSTVAVDKNAVVEENANEKIASGKLFSVDEASKAASALQNFVFKLQTKNDATTTTKMAAVEENVITKNANVLQNSGVDDRRIVEKSAGDKKVLSVDEANKAASALKNLMLKFQAKNAAIVVEDNAAVKNVVENADFGEKSSTDGKNAKNVRIADEKNVAVVENAQILDKCVEENAAKSVAVEENVEKMAVAAEMDDVTILEIVKKGNATRPNQYVPNFRHALNLLRTSLGKLDQILQSCKNGDFSDEKLNKLEYTFGYWRKFHRNFQNLLEFFDDEMKIGPEIFNKICVSNVENFAKSLRDKLSSALEILKNIQKIPDDSVILGNSVVEIPVLQIDSSLISSLEKILQQCLKKNREIIDRSSFIGFQVNYGDKLSKYNENLKSDNEKLRRHIENLKANLDQKTKQCQSTTLKMKEMQQELLKKGELMSKNDDSAAFLLESKFSPNEKPDFKFCLPPPAVVGDDRKMEKIVDDQKLSPSNKNKISRKDFKWEKGQPSGPNGNQLTFPAKHMVEASKLLRAATSGAWPQRTVGAVAGDPKIYFSKLHLPQWPRDVTDERFLNFFLDPVNGTFDEIAYEIVILAYEKFNVNFKTEILANLPKKKSSPSAKWSKIQDFLIETFDNWRSFGYTLERCQKFLTLLCTLLHWETFPMGANADVASMIIERAGRSTSDMLLLSRNVKSADKGRNPSTHLPVQAVVDRAREIVGNASRGFLIDLMLQK